MFKVRILRKKIDGIKTSFFLRQHFLINFFLQGVVIGSNILLMSGVYIKDDDD